MFATSSTAWCRSTRRVSVFCFAPSSIIKVPASRPLVTVSSALPRPHLLARPGVIHVELGIMPDITPLGPVIHITRALYLASRHSGNPISDTSLWAVYVTSGRSGRYHPRRYGRSTKHTQRGHLSKEWVGVGPWPYLLIQPRLCSSTPAAAGADPTHFPGLRSAKYCPPRHRHKSFTPGS